MRPAKVTDLDYIQFLIAARKVFSCCEAARCQPGGTETVEPVAHDAFTRLLERLPFARRRASPNTAALWQEVKPLVSKQSGILVLDDTALDKPYARKMELVARHWSGKQHQVVPGINQITLLWTDGQQAVPCDCRLYEKTGASKNQNFVAMPAVAKGRCFAPAMVCFDSLSSVPHCTGLVQRVGQLEGYPAHGWQFLTRLKKNRQVNPDGTGNVAVFTLDIAATGRTVHLKGFGFVTVFRTVCPNGHAKYWATTGQPVI